MPLVTRQLRKPIIDVKENWDDDWRPMTASEFGDITDAEPIDCVFASASHDISSASVRVRIGKVQQPGDTQPTIVDTNRFFLDWWMRVRYDYGTESVPNLKTIFVGRVEEEVRQIFAYSEHQAVVKIIRAFGAEQILHKISIDKSIWTPDGSGKPRVIDWLAPMNMGDERNASVGNRSADPQGDHYVYGEDNELWSALTYAEYLVSEFLNTDNPRDPKWAIIGSEDTIGDIDNLKEPIEFGQAETLASMFHTLFPREKGFDWYVYPLESGGNITFVIYVFSLSDVDVQFGTRTLHANPNSVQFEYENNLDLISSTLQESTSQMFKKIRVVGQRILMCGTFTRGTTLTDIEDGWSSDLETEYESGTGDDTDEALKQDDYRATDKFLDVYQKFKVVENVGAIDDGYFHECDDIGLLDLFSRKEPIAKYGRETLQYLPLNTSIVDALINDDSSAIDFSQSFYGPQAYLQRTDPGPGDPYVSAERIGVYVSPLPFDWGVQLSCSPNHLIADQYFTETNASETAPEYSYKYLKMTIAWRSFARFELRHVLNDDPDVAAVDGEIVVSVPEAEKWVIAPNTVIGLDEDGIPITSRNSTAVIRTDHELMEQALAGAIARYQKSRVRANIRVKGIWDWGNSVGTFLSGSGTPITYVRWNFDGDHETEIKTGFAL